MTVSEYGPADWFAIALSFGIALKMVLSPLADKLDRRRRNREAIAKIMRFRSTSPLTTSPRRQDGDAPGATDGHDAGQT